MPYTIQNNSCVDCDNCRIQCPVGAIKLVNDEYWIDPCLCNNCQGFYSELLVRVYFLMGRVMHLLVRSQSGKVVMSYRNGHLYLGKSMKMGISAIVVR
jgi:ferredoxin